MNTPTPEQVTAFLEDMYNREEDGALSDCIHNVLQALKQETTKLIVHSVAERMVLVDALAEFMAERSNVDVYVEERYANRTLSEKLAKTAEVQDRLRVAARLLESVEVK